MASLSAWLKENKLSKLSEILNENGITELEDLQDLETKNDVDEFVNDLGKIKVVFRNRLKKAILAIDNIREEHIYMKEIQIQWISVGISSSTQKISIESHKNAE
eukprot:139607_1